MDLSPLRELPELWQEQAERYEADGVPGHAALLRRVADELGETLDRWWLEELTLEEAAEERGLAYDTIQRRVASGDSPTLVGNTGRGCGGRTSIGRIRWPRATTGSETSWRRCWSGDNQRGTGSFDLSCRFVYSVHE